MLGLFVWLSFLPLEPADNADVHSPALGSDEYVCTVVAPDPEREVPHSSQRLKSDGSVVVTSLLFALGFRSGALVYTEQRFAAKEDAVRHRQIHTGDDYNFWRSNHHSCDNTNRPLG